VGVLLSAGGGAFSAAIKIASGLPFEFTVVTDRECGAELNCKQLSIPVRRIVEPSNRTFSVAVREHFERDKVDFVVLLFSRLITAELYEEVACFNVHPSLLPAFPGLSPVKKAVASGARFIGATLHGVDASVDGGPIIAQTVAALPFRAELEWCNRLSFLQKVVMLLVLLDLITTGRLEAKARGGFSLSPLAVSPAATTNPALSIPVLIEGLEILQAELGMRIVS
jgi:phosphoribosylglycinamide formyltransferase-1